MCMNCRESGRKTTCKGIRAGYPIAILSTQRKLKFGFGFPYALWDTTPNIGGYDKGLSMYDYRKKPQSIQYPPGMGPKENPCEWMWKDEPTTFDGGRDYEINCSFDGAPAPWINL